MGEAVCVVPVSPVRLQPSHKSEMVSQLLFGDVVTIMAEEAEWQHISVQHDGYEGWCTAVHLIPISGHEKNGPPAFTGEWVNKMYMNSVPMYLPFGCEISRFLDASFGINVFRYEGKLLPRQHQPVEEQITQISKFFLNTSYLWGGRSVFGIDCSGFSQLVFRVSGIAILRDAWQQAEQGTSVQPDQGREGDLAFFKNEAGRVVHVGILLNENQIIHAAGKVRIDRLTVDGIINNETGLKSHSLSGIRRYF